MGAPGMFSSGQLPEDRRQQYGQAWDKTSTQSLQAKGSSGGFDLKKVAPVAALLLVGFLSQSANLSFVLPSGVPSRSSLTASYGNAFQPGSQSTSTVAMHAYPPSGVFPGGGDGSWREGKGGSFNKGQKVDIAPGMFSSGQLPEDRRQQYGQAWDKTSTQSLQAKGSSGGFVLKKVAPVAALLLVGFLSQSANLN